MEKYIHRENLALLRKRFAEARDESERQVILMAASVPHRCFKSFCAFPRAIIAAENPGSILTARS
jgi:hypothetical protein